MKLQVFGVAAAVVLLAAWTRPAATPLHRAPASTYTATMNGPSATPPNDGNGTGRASFTYSGHMLHYQITVHDLSGPATMAHIHIGDLGVSGPPTYTFEIAKVASGKLSEGTIDLSSYSAKGVSGDSLMVLLNNGGAYVNVHTAAHPGGEIRGQIVKE